MGRFYYMLRLRKRYIYIAVSNTFSEIGCIFMPRWFSTMFLVRFQYYQYTHGSKFVLYVANMSDIIYTFLWVLLSLPDMIYAHLPQLLEISVRDILSHTKVELSILLYRSVLQACMFAGTPVEWGEWNSCHLVSVAVFHLTAINLSKYMAAIWSNSASLIFSKSWGDSVYLPSMEHSPVSTWVYYGCCEVRKPGTWQAYWLSYSRSLELRLINRKNFLAQDCGNSIEWAVQIPQSCSKPSRYMYTSGYGEYYFVFQMSVRGSQCWISTAFAE